MISNSNEFSYDKALKKPNRTLIENNDLFRLLKKRHHQKLSASKNNDIRGVFYETICMLEILEQRLTMLYERTYPTRENFMSAKESGDKETLTEIIKFYWLMCVEREIYNTVSRGYFFSQRVGVYFKYMESHPNAPFWKSASEWVIEDFPYKKVFDFIENYINFQIMTLEIDSFKQFEKGKKVFDDLLERHKKLKVFCLDIVVAPQEGDVRRNREALIMGHVMLGKVTYVLFEKYGLIAEYSRIDLGIDSSFILQFILVFGGNTCVDERELKATLRSILEDQMSDNKLLKFKGFKVDVRDFSNIIKSLDNDHKYQFNHIISANSKSARAAFEYWVLSYFYIVDSLIRSDLAELSDHPFIGPHLGGVCYFVYPIHAVTSKPNSKWGSKQLEYFNDLDFGEWENKLIGKVKNLPLQSRQDLKLITLLYQQYSMLLDWYEDELKLLLLIEYFMRLIQHNHVFACINEEFESLSVGDIQKKPLKILSLQAIMYLVINNKLKSIRDFTNKISRLHWISWRVIKFIDQHYKLNYRVFSINYTGISELQNCLKKFKAPDIYRVEGRGGDQSLFDLEKQESIKVKKNQAKARSYLNETIKEDIIALCFDFYYRQNFKYSVEQNIVEFNLLLGDFLKNLKRTKKVSGTKLLAYMGTRILKKESLETQIVLIFSASDLSDYDEQANTETIMEVIQKVHKYWKEYISIKENKICAQAKKRRVVKPEISNYGSKQLKLDAIFKDEDLGVSSISWIMPFRGHKEFVHIKHHDSNSLKLFKSRVVDFYTAHGLLHSWKYELQKRIPDIGNEKSKISNIDQFLKGHIASERNGQSKQRKDNDITVSEVSQENINMENNLEYVNGLSFKEDEILKPVHQLLKKIY